MVIMLVACVLWSKLEASDLNLLVFRIGPCSIDHLPNPVYKILNYPNVYRVGLCIKENSKHASFDKINAPK